MKKMLLTLFLAIGFHGINANEDNQKPYSEDQLNIFNLTAMIQEMSVANSQTALLNPMSNTPEKKACVYVVSSFMRTLVASKNSEEANQIIEDFLPKQAECTRILFAPRQIINETKSSKDSSN